MRLYPASLTAPGACFSKVPIIIKRTRKAVDGYMKDRGFNSFASYMRKLSVNETKWTILLANPRSYSFYIDFCPRRVPAQRPKPEEAP